ncbi:hypothetical protein [Salinibacter ruber]|uniref:restriction endonuclease subunit S n=1 Tax=Salinibacter ruber TaxID=146919 RepID=UPI002166EEDC|nr:hypothetical protein [Salinibacter ruber]MCS4198464.1 hypothetical protein [Salinibacter ruber]
MSVTSISRLNRVNKERRIDPEFYRPRYLEYDKIFDKIDVPIVELKDVIKDGYRVVYENTEILNEDYDDDKHVKFLQASDILDDFPAIDKESIGWVTNKDLERYPKGQVRRGEILVEVKGKAEKVVRVPDDFPKNVLITGTLYKLLPDESAIDSRYLTLYLLSDLGKELRDREKTNTLVSYVNKKALYGIKIPLLETGTQKKIGDSYTDAMKLYRTSKDKRNTAEHRLLDALGLDEFTPSEQNTFTSSFSDLSPTLRLDAGFYRPKYVEASSALENKGASQDLSEIASLEKGNQARGEGNRPYASIGDLHGPSLYPSDTADPSEDLVTVDHQDLILAVTGATIGKNGMNLTEHRVAISGDMVAIRPYRVNPYYLLTVLGSPMTQALCERDKTGTTNEHLGPNDIEKFPIPRLEPEVEERIGNLTRESLRARSKAKETVWTAVDKLEQTILNHQTEDRSSKSVNKA